MESRWFNIAVVLMWLCTTTWLVVAKVVPPLRRGQPPSYRSIYSRDTDGEEAVGWNLSLNNKSLGWAISRLKRPSAGSSSGQMTEVTSRIHFDRIPLAELSPPWMRVMLRASSEPVDDLQMDVFSSLMIDPLGHLEGFRSSLNAGGMREAIRIEGKVHATMLKIDIRSGDFVYPFETYLPADALVSDELSPQSQLLGLRLGQEWTVPVFSALRPPNNPVDILQAKVESQELLMWNDEAVPVFEVVYRPDSGAALSSTGQSRAKIWVREDGVVLKQEVSVFGSVLVFSRMSEAESARKASESEPEEKMQRWPRHRQRGRQYFPSPPLGLPPPTNGGQSEVAPTGTTSPSIAPTSEAIEQELAETQRAATASSTTSGATP